MTAPPERWPALPIDQAQGDLRDALARARPIIVVAPTGSGKSTRLPGWLAADLDGRVLVVEPRRVACRALAVHLAQLQGERLGDTVGYRVRFEDRMGDDTRVCFVTPGVALNMIASGDIESFAAVMVDEFHERGWEGDLVVALLRERGFGGDGMPALLLCSATLETESLAVSLGALVVRSEGRSFPVEIDHRGDGPPSARNLDERVSSAVRERVQAGDVLVFLPGKGEIEDCARALGDLEARGVELIRVHGGVSPEKLVAAFRGGDRRRVYLATNVAESSVTLPGVRTVVDSGLARVRLHRGGRSALTLTPIANDSMDQRAGRAGRVAAGTCLRLWASTFSPRPVTPAGIERIELEDVLLRAASCGLTGAAFESAPWVTPPPTFAVERARAKLARVGALTPDGELTARGRALARMPVSADEARILWDPPAGLAGTVADLAAIVERRRDLLLPMMAIPAGERTRVRRARAELFAGIDDEVSLQLCALRRGHAREHGLHRAGLDETRRLADRLRRAIGAEAASSDETPPARAQLVRHLLAQVPEAAFVRRPRADKKSRTTRGRPPGRVKREPWGNGEIELEVRPFEPLDDRDPESIESARAGIILDHEWLGTDRSARGVGRLLLPCSPAQLGEAGLGEVEVGRIRIERGDDGPEIHAMIERRLAGVVLVAEDERLHGAALRAAVGQLVVEGRRLGELDAELGDRLMDALHLWTLLDQLASQKGEPPPDPCPAPEDYVCARLESLGLESAADLALLAADDLLPDLEGLAARRGIDLRQLRSLDQDFPRTWTHLDGVYACTVDLERRRVTLEPASRKAKAAREPPASMLPRFRGFRVDFVKASRRLRLR